jgi:large subunit ribosomal protein L28
MSTCSICGKAPANGNSISSRGKPKYLGGNGVKITGKSPRRFLPNIQQVRTVSGKTKACTKCLRAGLVLRAIKKHPFEAI